VAPQNAAVAPPLLDRLASICGASLPGSAFIVHGSLSLGDYKVAAAAITVAHVSI
jgi:hypothetical protein